MNATAQNPRAAETTTDKDIVYTSRTFAKELRATSWWHVASTLTLLASALTLAVILPWWPARLVAAVLGALLFVRGFILYHDFMHGAILRNSRIANVIFSVFGLIILTPPTSWKTSHNFHHAIRRWKSQRPWR